MSLRSRFIVLGVCVPFHAVHAGVLYVDSAAPPGGDGSSWASAYTYLQDALDHASLAGGGEIRIAQGLYLPGESVDDSPTRGGDPRLATFRLLDGVALIGGYAGREASDPDERDPSVYRSVLSGDLARDDTPGGQFSYADNTYHVIESWGNDATAIVDGVTIRDGRADRPFDRGWWPERRDDSAGGALLVESDAVFRDCVFTANHAEANASIWVALEGPFDNVEAGSGAVMVAGGAPVFEGCVFESNSANRVAGALGLNRTSARVTRCDFIGNRAGSDGFSDLSFGGAIGDASFQIDGPRARVESCRFIGNTHAGLYGGGGGALFTIFSDTQYAGCLFLANTADGEGGAVFADNLAFVEFHACTIAGNAAARVAGGVSEISEVSDAYVFANCVVWGNTADTARAPNVNMASQNGNFALYDSIIERGLTDPIFVFDLSRLAEFDPAFRDPAGPDGVAWTGDEDLRLTPGSPAIDYGNTERLPAWLVTDLEGGPRLVDVPGVSDTGVGGAPLPDPGAYEATPGCGPTDLAAPDGVLDLADIQAFVAAFVGARPAADLNGDGVYDLADLGLFVDAFTAGCP